MGVVAIVAGVLLGAEMALDRHVDTLPVLLVRASGGPGRPRR
jgi:hypothetical protein